jgi:ABC-type transporter lipoprotein component MlaA
MAPVGEGLSEGLDEPDAFEDEFDEEKEMAVWDPIDPINRWLADSQFWPALGIHAGVRVNKLSLDKDASEAITEEQVDPYIFLRDAYMQCRSKLVDK